VVGAGLSGLSCAYYLSLSGCHVDLYDETLHPRDRLVQALPEAVAPAALARDVQGILRHGINFHGSQELGPGLVEALQRLYDALFLDLAPFGIPEAEMADVQLTDFLSVSSCEERMLPSALKTAGSPVLLVGKSPPGRPTVAAAAAAGRHAAVAIGQCLEAKGEQRGHRTMQS
jgi:hypothetical protein